MIRIYLLDAILSFKLRIHRLPLITSKFPVWVNQHSSHFSPQHPSTINPPEFKALKGTKPLNASAPFVRLSLTSPDLLDSDLSLISDTQQGVHVLHSLIPIVLCLASSLRYVLDFLHPDKRETKTSSYRGLVMPSATCRLRSITKRVAWNDLLSYLLDLGNTYSPYISA